MLSTKYIHGYRYVHDSKAFRVMIEKALSKSDQFPGKRNRWILREVYRFIMTM